MTFWGAFLYVTSAFGAAGVLTAVLCKLIPQAQPEPHEVRTHPRIGRLGELSADSSSPATGAGTDPEKAQ